MLVCSICSSPFPFHRPCDQVHASLCHDCHLLNMAGNPLDSRAHLAPRETPILALTPRQRSRMMQQHASWEAEAQRRLEDVP